MDVLIIPTDVARYKLAADCVLLSGTVIVDESMLTGGLKFLRFEQIVGRKAFCLKVPVFYCTRTYSLMQVRRFRSRRRRRPSRTRTSSLWRSSRVTCSTPARWCCRRERSWSSLWAHSSCAQVLLEKLFNHCFADWWCDKPALRSSQPITQASAQQKASCCVQCCIRNL